MATTHKEILKIKGLSTILYLNFNYSILQDKGKKLEKLQTMTGALGLMLHSVKSYLEWI